jgi:glutathione S-transferase
MLVLYDYVASANCLKARMTLSLLGIEHERVAMNLFAGETLTEAFRTTSPSGRVPVLVLPDGTKLPESNAIVLFVADGSELMPQRLEERAQVWRWMFFEQNQLEPNVGMARFWRMTGRSEGREALMEMRVSGSRAALDALELHLSSRTFLVGDRFSVADVSVYAYAHIAGDAGIDLAGYRAITAWLKQVERQPNFVNDLVPYPDDARLGAGVSAYS